VLPLFCAVGGNSGAPVYAGMLAKASPVFLPLHMWLINRELSEGGKQRKHILETAAYVTFGWYSVKCGRGAVVVLENIMVREEEERRRHSHLLVWRVIIALAVTGSI